MCRLLMMNKDGLNKMGREHTLAFMNQLEKSCGGHGNGIAFIDQGVCTFTNKGVTFKNEDIASLLFNEENELPDWFIYHTRVASKGTIKDSNCHPYWNEDKSFVAAMNGTISSFGDMAKGLDITDTELVFKNMNAFGIGEASLLEFTPRWLLFRDNKVHAVNPSTAGGLKFIQHDSAIIIASEAYTPLVKEFDSMEGKYVWHEGEEIKKMVYTSQVTTNYYGRYGAYDAYGYNYYDEQESWYDRYYGKQKEQETKKLEEPKKEEIIGGDENIVTYLDDEMKLLEIVDDANYFLNQTKQDPKKVKEFIEDEIGSMEVVCNEEKCKFKIIKLANGKWQCHLYDEIGDIIY